MIWTGITTAHRWVYLLSLAAVCTANTGLAWRGSAPRRFSQVEWQRAGACIAERSFTPDTRRVRMAETLLQTHLRPGLRMEEAHRLLGAPHATVSGGFGGGVSTQDEGYLLVHLPTQELPALLLRYHTPDPYLWLHYEDGRLLRAAIR